MSKVTEKLEKFLASTATLAMKTQNYHWHVTGPNFKTLHLLFEEQYRELFEDMDLVAERIRALNEIAPASFEEFIKLSAIKSGNPSLSSEKMIKELRDDHKKMIDLIHEIIPIAQKEKDEATASLLSDRIISHEKTMWMLNASL